MLKTAFIIMTILLCAPSLFAQSPEKRLSLQERVKQRLEMQESKESKDTAIHQTESIINDIKMNGAKAIDSLKGQVNGMEGTH